jgi:L-ascorbate metabolism protein UlaG (beta-lactamase superfamily)
MAAKYDGISFERPGHATVRIKTAEGLVLYLDPWSEVLDDSPGDADIVIVTHDDRDHYDQAAIVAVSNDATTVVAYDAIDTSNLDQDVVLLGADERREIKGIEVRSVPAYNRPEGPHIRPGGEPYHPEETVIGIVLTVDGTVVYYTSDTDALDELAEVEADVVLPPIGGTYTMDRHEAAKLVREIGPELVLPVHYDTDAIDGVDADPEAFADELSADGITVDLF